MTATKRKPARRASGSGDTDRNKIYAMVTDRIVAELEAGTAPWRKPWKMTGGWPLRMNNGKPYRGVNVFLLQMAAMAGGYASPYWGSYDHIAELAGMVKNAATGRWESPDGTPRGIRRGETSTMIIFWRQVTFHDTDPDTGEKTTRRVPVLRYFRVFNACQADGLPAKYFPAVPDPETAPDPVEAAEAVIRRYLEDDGPEWSNANPDRACYMWALDRVNVPPLTSYEDVNEYYNTAFHEMGHSTGHGSRLARHFADAPGDCVFGSPDYSKEELVAEMTCAMLCAIAGTDTPGVTKNSAAYLAGWIRKLKGDPKLAVQAGAQAQHAADLILGVTWEDEPAELDTVTEETG